MGKYDFLKNENIVPIHKTLNLEYESGYGGEKKTMEIHVYPYTVEEKLEMENASKKYSKMLKSDDESVREEGLKRSKEATYKSVYFVLRKEDPDITIEDIKKLPESWYTEIVMTALEFEGVTKEQLKNISEEKK